MVKNPPVVVANGYNRDDMNAKRTEKRSMVLLSSTTPCSGEEKEKEGGRGSTEGCEYIPGEETPRDR